MLEDQALLARPFQKRMANSALSAFSAGEQQDREDLPEESGGHGVRGQIKGEEQLDASVHTQEVVSHDVPQVVA